jgi:hypothetical protein
MASALHPARERARIVGLGLLICIGGGLFSVNYTAGAVLLAGVALFLGLYELAGRTFVRLPVALLALGLLLAGLWQASRGLDAPTVTGPGNGGVGALPIYRYAVSDYVARVRPASSGDESFVVEEHLTLKPASSSDGPRPVEVSLPPRIVRSESIGLAQRRVRIASGGIVDSDVLVPAVRDDLGNPAADVRLSFPYNARLTFEVFGLPGGAFSGPLLSSAAPAQTAGQVAWTSDVHSVDNGFDYFSGPGVLYPVLSAFHNLGSLSQGLLLLATNIALYLWVKVAEPVLTDLAKAVLKKRLPAVPAAAH